MLDHKKYLCSPFQCSLNTDSEERVDQLLTVNIFGSSLDESDSVQWKDYYWWGSCQTDKYPSKCFISIFIELDRKAQREHDIDINVFSSMEMIASFSHWPP